MKNEIVRCICTDMSVDGHGIARSKDLVVFVKEMIPGETADVRITAEKKNYAYGIVEAMIEGSPYRVTSECPVAYKCGGCDLRHISYEGQLSFKKKLLENTFRSLDVTIEDVVASPKKDHYRNKVQIPVKDGKAGFYRRYSHDIVEEEHCLLQFEGADELLKDTLEILREFKILEDIRHIFLRKGEGTGEVMLGIIVRRKDVPHTDDFAREILTSHPDLTTIILNVNTRDDNVILGEEEIILYGPGVIRDIYDGITVEISLKSFYQVNHDQMVNLYTKACSYLEEGESVLDLYSGIGTISLFAGRKAKEVIGVEIVRDAVSNAKRNAELNHMKNVSFFLDDAGSDMKKYLEGKDAVILDPPRKGISKALISDLIESKIPKIVYISCNPATLQRDLELLKDAYDFDTVTPFDMFPHTVHTECVVKLTRKG